MLEILESRNLKLVLSSSLSKNYQDWLMSHDSPAFSHTLFKDYVVPHLNDENGLLWIVIDNLRYDQYGVIEPLLNNHYKKDEEHSYFSILQRNSIY